MNPFTLFFLVLSLCILINHLIGNTAVTIVSVVSMTLFLMEYKLYRELKSAEPSFLPGITEKMFFLFHYKFVRVKLIIAEILAAWVIISTIISTFGILK